MMNIKKCLAAACVFAALMAVPTWAAAPLTPKTAGQMAGKLVPGQSEMLQSDEEDGIYEFRYYNKNYQEWYNVKLDKALARVISFDSSRTSCQGGSTVIVTEEAAQKKLQDELKDIQSISCELENDNGMYTYVVEFTAKDYYGTYLINAENGYVLTRNVTVGALSVTTIDGPVAAASVQETAASSIYIGTDKAKKLAQNKVPGAEIDSCEFINDSGRAVYNGVMHKGCFQYDFSVDAITGTMVRWDISNIN